MIFFNSRLCCCFHNFFDVAILTREITWAINIINWITLNKQHCTGLWFSNHWYVEKVNKTLFSAFQLFFFLRSADARWLWWCTQKKIKFKKMNHEFTVNSSWSGIFQRTEEHMALDLQLTARTTPTSRSAHQSNFPRCVEASGRAAGGGAPLCTPDCSSPLLPQYIHYILLLKNDSYAYW